MARIGMSNLLEANGLRLGYTAKTVTVTEPATGFKIVFNNDGTVRSNTFPPESFPLVEGYFKRSYPFVEDAREVDREYA
ncbi:hypothetical protein JS530_07450 [Bifidobacterium sp. LC6]|uniref:Uncharacterized protein n=1 Tax=Bifidobacterium colobi TaxID=2809026 RepID=A0ABS5UW52_9BIFI|nr:hypothetical protein [Bifidobacterium colobi]MBT1175335.1 hypothetical protein [Bifidobacterium colobi]